VAGEDKGKLGACGRKMGAWKKRKRILREKGIQYEKISKQEMSEKTEQEPR